MDFEITLPDNPINSEEIVNKNKRMFSEDFEKAGFLTKILVFTKMNEPLNSQDVNLLLQKYYKIEFDINVVKRGLKKLSELGILNSITSGDIMATPNNKLDDRHKEIYNKFFVFLDHIPKQFRKQYNQVNYYWVSDSGERDYLEWCCRLLGFGFKKIGEKKNDKKNDKKK